jgi:hypothetical protein
VSGLRVKSGILILTREIEQILLLREDQVSLSNTKQGKISGHNTKSNTSNSHFTTHKISELTGEGKYEPDVAYLMQPLQPNVLYWSNMKQCGNQNILCADQRINVTTLIL